MTALKKPLGRLPVPFTCRECFSLIPIEDGHQCLMRGKYTIWWNIDEKVYFRRYQFCPAPRQPCEGCGKLFFRRGWIVSDGVRWCNECF